MSTFKFTPKSEEELSELLAEGDAGFEIVTSTFKHSQLGKPMIVLRLKIWDINGEEGVIDDFLVLDETSKFSMRKLKHLCESVGLKQLYDCGEIDASCFVGGSGKLRLGVQRNRKDKEGNVMRDRNAIWDYLVQEKNKFEPTLKDDEMPTFK